MVKSLLAKKWKQYLNPVFTPATGLLYFGVILFHYHYFEQLNPLHRILKTDKLLWLFYIYAPVVLAFNLVRIPSAFAGFAAFVAFVCTLLGIAATESALLSVRRGMNALDLLMHLLAVTQMAVLVYRLLLQIRTPGGIFKAPKEMHLEPRPLLALAILLLIPGLTFLGKYGFGWRPPQVTELVLIAGMLLIYFFGFFAGRKKYVV